VTTNHATAVCQSGYQPIITSPSPRRGRKRARCIAHFTMIIWHNNQLHSIVFSGTKQIIFSFRLGLVALPATCYLAPWQWPVTGAPATEQVSRAAKLRAWGRVRKPHNSITARPWRPSLPDEDHAAFPPQASAAGPLLMRAPRRQDISGPWQILSESRSVASGSNGPPNRACRKRSRRPSTSSPRTGGPKSSWVSLIRAS